MRVSISFSNRSKIPIYAWLSQFFFSIYNYDERSVTEISIFLLIIEKKKILTYLRCDNGKKLEIEYIKCIHAFELIVLQIICFIYLKHICEWWFAANMGNIGTNESIIISKRWQCVVCPLDRVVLNQPSRAWLNQFLNLETVSGRKLEFVTDSLPWIGHAKSIFATLTPWEASLKGLPYKNRQKHGFWAWY